jgi:hypothetical protein
MTIERGTANVRVDVLDAEGEALVAHARLWLGVEPASPSEARGRVEPDARYEVADGAYAIRLPDGVLWPVDLRRTGDRGLAVFSSEAPDLARLGGE